MQVNIKKRGQVSIFVIAGLILFFLIMGILFFKGEIIADKINSKSKPLSFGSDVQNYAQQCIRKTAEDAVVYIGKHGGYYSLPELSDNEMLLPFYFYQNKNHVISKEELKNQLALYVKEELPFCLQNFYPFRKMGYKIIQGEINAELLLNPEKIFFKVSLPISATKEDITKEFSLFSSSVPSRIDAMHNFIGQFMILQQEDPSSICISCIVKSAVENDLRVEMNTIEGTNSILFRVIDKKTIINHENYEFEFLNEYDFDENKEIIKSNQ